jgi:hypothetical protein
VKGWVRFAIRRLYGQSRSGERPMREGLCQTEFLDSAEPQGHFREKATFVKIPAGWPDDQKQDSQKQEA